MNRRRAICRTCLAVSSLIALVPTSTPARAGGPPATQPTVTVRIDNFRFAPAALEIAAGTTVTWRNSDDVPHTVTGSPGAPAAFDSGPLDTDEKFSFTFRAVGKYTYYCKVHPHMTAVVVVK